jgi:mono/diheme cytochrome c family protein
MFSLNQIISTAVKASSLALIVVALAACGGSSGGGNNDDLANGNSGGGSGSSGGSSSSGSTDLAAYSGPAPASDDVQAFRTSMWTNLASSSRCGGCHVSGGSASPAFMDTGNINLAHSITLGLVNFTNTAASRLVTKVEEGHNCWLTSNLACAALIEGWIQQWRAPADATTFLGSLNLQDPVLRTVGQSKQFPEDPATGGANSYASTVYPLVNQYCATCHAPDTGLQQQPYLGGITSNTTIVDPEATNDLLASYDAARSRMNLESPELSRLVARLEEGHNCWSGNCSNDADRMRDVIGDFSDGIVPTEVDEDLVTSRALTLDDGFTPSGGSGRVETNVIAKWIFKEDVEEPGLVSDLSGVDPELDLRFMAGSNIEWLGSGGIRINSGRIQGSSPELFERLSETGEYSIEAWVVPLNVEQGDDDNPARIAVFSGSNENRNFMLGQVDYDYEFLSLSSVSGADELDDAIESAVENPLQATLQHVVATYSATEGRKVYVNGSLVTEPEPQGAGNFNAWNRNYVFAVGAEVSGMYQWQGNIRLMAIHDRAISEDDIQTNYEVGVGEKNYLLFSISDYVPIPRSYIVMEVEILDDYGYQFNEPFFVSLDPDVTNIDDFVIEGMRIGVNGQEAAVGQAYSRVDDVITQQKIDDGEGRYILSSVGTVIAVDQSADNDEFFLTFENLNGTTNAFSEGTFSPQAPVASTEFQDTIGIKTFDEINESLAALTDIPVTDASDAFGALRLQLPSNDNINTFAAAQQMAVVQLAVNYCSQLVSRESNSGTNTNYFGSFDFSAQPNTAFGSEAARSNLITPMLDRLLSSAGTDDQPAPAVAGDLLDDLVEELVANCDNNSCVQIPQEGDPLTRVEEIAVATCATAYSSGMMLIQ